MLRASVTCTPTRPVEGSGRCRPRASPAAARRPPAAARREPAGRPPAAESPAGEPRGRTPRANPAGEPRGRTPRANPAGEPRGSDHAKGRDWRYVLRVSDEPSAEELKL